MNLSGYFNPGAIVALCICVLANPGLVLAEADWTSFTIDNDAALSLPNMAR